MKKILAAMLTAVMVIGTAGCGAGEKNTETTGGEAAKEGSGYTITLTHAVAEDTSQQAGSLAFKEYVEANSGMKVNIYPNAQMGGDREQIEGVQEGSITMMTCGSAAQANFVTGAIVFDGPFAFKSEEHMEAVFKDQAFLNALSADYENAGFHMLGLSSLGFRMTTANKDIRSPEDVKKLTIRTMENKYHMALWEALGANPTPLAFNELYTALQGTVEAQENPMELIYAQKFYEQQKYIIKTKHLPQDLVWIMNKNFYDSLPEDLKAVVDEGAARAVEAAAAFSKENESNIQKKIEEEGITVTDLTQEELKPFAEKTKDVWKLIEKDCPKEVYETFINALNK